MNNLKVEWLDACREPQNPPNPQYPNGIDLDVTGGQLPACETKLPYPAKRCGYYVVSCADCGFTGMVTTAGRIDDPRSVRVPCKMRVAGDALPTL